MSHIFYNAFLKQRLQWKMICLQNTKKQRIAEAAVDTMKQQMLELCRSDTLSRAREQHDRDLAVMKEQHEAALLALQQKLDSTSEALNEQVCSLHVTRTGWLADPSRFNINV